MERRNVQDGDDCQYWSHPEDPRRHGSKATAEASANSLMVRSVTKPWYELPERKSPDIRDAEEHATIARVLSALPADHSARLAYAQGATTIALTHLVPGHPEISAALSEAYLAAWRRNLARWGSFRP